MTMPIRARYIRQCIPSLALILFLLLILVLGGIFYAKTLIRHERHHFEAQDQAAAQVAAIALRQQLRDAATDVIYLVHLPHLQRMLTRPDSRLRTAVADEFAAYMNSKGNFDQLRWIDQHGMEQIRVNFVNGHAVILGRRALQNKSHRPYFINTVKLPIGALYVSPLDLNIEHGHIEMPRKPVIRLAIPIADAKGRPNGIIIVNYLGDKFITAFRKSINLFSGHMLLLNQHGYGMYGMRPENEWGFMTGNASAFVRAHPQAWRAIKSANNGNIVLADGLWSWSSIYPLHEIKTGIQNATGVVPLLASISNYEWKAVVHLPPAELTVIHHQVWHTVGIIFGVLILTAALVGVWSGGSRIRIAQLNEALKERASAAEAASLAKENFLANMSHEIRTPMNAILGLAYLLTRTELPEESKQLVHKIHAAGRLLMAIINDILDFSKIEAGRLEIEYAPFLLGDILDDISNVMATNAGDKDLELIISPPVNIGPLCGDALRLGQILINLTSNAIKFTDKGYVEVKITTISQDADSVYLRFSVRDTGIGIEPEAQKELFAPFVQADTSTTRRFGGTGLGLSISRRLVELLGGEIGVNSVPGVGTEFWFTVKLDRSKDSRLSVPEMTGLNVLVADDNSIARDALSATVASLGWEGITAESGEAAIQQMASWDMTKKPNRVIVLDWKMPGMDGLETARVIRQASAGRNEPIVIMVTAYSHDALLASPDSHLIDAVLDKPVTPSSLYDAVIRAIQKRKGVMTPVTPSLPVKRLLGARILVVDDSDINREVAQHIFTGEGAQVFLANDGRQALDWLDTNPDQVDIVLMDVQMPVMDGFDATRHIKQNPKTRELPVVALTAGAFRSQQDAAKEAGMIDYIAKPFNVDAAVALIRNLVEQSVVAPENSSDDTRPVTNVPEIRSWPGMDVKQALTVWGDAEIYRKYLGVFSADYADSVTRLENMAHADALALAHKLKGVAGNLALNDVATYADELERNLGTHMDIQCALDNLREAMAVALASISGYVSASNDAGDSANESFTKPDVH